MMGVSGLVALMMLWESRNPDTPPPPPLEDPSAQEVEPNAAGDEAKTVTTSEAEAPVPAEDLRDSLLDAGAADGGKVANAVAVTARMRGRFRRCYQQGLATHPAMQGTVQLSATIGPKGDVIRVGDNGGGSLAPIVPCLKAVVSSGLFAPPTGGSALISIPITFVWQD